MTQDIDHILNHISLKKSRRRWRIFGLGVLTILALSFIFLNFILMNIPWFADLKPWFLTYHLNLWQQLYVQPVPWPRIGESLSLLAGFNATFFALGAVAFGLRDLKS